MEKRGQWKDVGKYNNKSVGLTVYDGKMQKDLDRLTSHLKQEKSGIKDQVQ